MPTTPLYITSYPRSGNTWVQRLLSDILDSPLKTIPEMTPVWYGDKGGDYVVVKRHSKEREGRTCFVYRDPRDVAVSRWFYYDLPSLESAIKGMIEANNGDRYGPNGVWIGPYEPFITHWWNNPNLAECQIEYSTLHTAPVDTLHDAVFDLTGLDTPRDKIVLAVERQSFGEQVKRLGAEHAMRKGIIGDWRNHFDPECAKLITDHLGDLMMRQGFIDSLRWYESLY